MRANSSLDIPPEKVTADEIPRKVLDLIYEINRQWVNENPKSYYFSSACLSCCWL